MILLDYFTVGKRRPIVCTNPSAYGWVATLGPLIHLMMSVRSNTILVSIVFCYGGDVHGHMPILTCIDFAISMAFIPYIQYKQNNGPGSREGLL
jgi:hypothetical protein